jgi:hypothetical protein
MTNFGFTHSFKHGTHTSMLPKALAEMGGLKPFSSARWSWRPGGIGGAGVMKGYPRECVKSASVKVLTQGKVWVGICAGIPWPVLPT